MTFIVVTLERNLPVFYLKFPEEISRRVRDGKREIFRARMFSTGRISFVYDTVFINIAHSAVKCGTNDSVQKQKPCLRLPVS